MAGTLAAVAALVGLAALFVFAGHPEKVVAVGRLVQPHPAGPRRGSGGAFARKFAEGLAVMREPRALAVSLAWSMALGCRFVWASGSCRAHSV